MYRVSKIGKWGMYLQEIEETEGDMKARLCVGDGMCDVECDLVCDVVRDVEWKWEWEWKWCGKKLTAIVGQGLHFLQPSLAPIWISTLPNGDFHGLMPEDYSPLLFRVLHRPWS